MYLVIFCAWSFVKQSANKHQQTFEPNILNSLTLPDQTQHVKVQ